MANAPNTIVAMNSKVFIISLITSIAFLASCSKKDGSTPTPNRAEFIDQGYIPASVSTPNDFQSAAYCDGYVFVATNDGLWKNHLATKQWTRAGLDGKYITAIYKHPTVSNLLFAGVKTDYTPTCKTLYISRDGGMSWTPASGIIYDSLNGCYENYSCFAVRPNNPNHIYANLEGGPMIAVSVDGGDTWKRMNKAEESSIGYQSAIAFLPDKPDLIYQGSENPLDDAWLARYDIDASDPTLLTNFTKIVDINTWSNRRPNELVSYSYTGNSLYVGQEGALSKVTGTTCKLIFKSDDNNYPYTYIKGIWVDPNNTQHVVFGGALNNNVQPMQLYETYDEGATIIRYENKLGLANPQVQKIVATNTYPAILLNDQGANKVKLVLFKPANK